MRIRKGDTVMLRNGDFAEVVSATQQGIKLRVEKPHSDGTTDWHVITYNLNGTPHGATTNEYDVVA